MTRCYISLGSNLGDRLSFLREAVHKLNESVTVVKASKIYETAPMYVQDQPAFMNAAVEIETNLGPLPLLKLLKRTELDIGRLTRQRFGPREIDLDLVSYGTLRYVFSAGERALLVLPHPRVAERRFVLQPLYDLDGQLPLPGLGVVSDFLMRTESQASTVHELSDKLCTAPEAG